MGTAEDVEERQIVCSACLQVVPESLIHVIPYYNGDVGRYVTTYRCERCWLPSLEKTRARLEITEDETEIASAVAFFERNGVILHEFRRNDPTPVVRKMLVQMIGLLRSAAIRPLIGPLEPMSEMYAPAFEMKKNEKLAEAAYDAMYEAKSYSVKDYFDDARGYFTKAIDIAKRAGLHDEVARLTARRDHIVGVYNSQFRGLR
jgi:hypothetical protein